MTVASLVLVLVVGTAFAVLLLTISDLRSSGRLVAKSRNANAAADRLEELVIDLETGVRGFVIARQERFLEPWRAARAAFPAEARTLEQLTDQPAQKRRVRNIERDIASYIADYSVPLVSAVRRNDPVSRSVATTTDGKLRIDALRREFERFKTSERAVLGGRQHRDDVNAGRAVAAATVGLAGSVVLILIFGGYLVRAIVRPLRRASRLAGELAAGDLATRIPEESVGEIGALERSLNRMAASLEADRGELRRLADEQAALRRLATLVAEDAPPGEVFEEVIHEAGLLVGSDAAALIRFDTGQTAIAVSSWSRAGGSLALGTQYPVVEGTAAWVVRETRGPARIASYAGVPGEGVAAIRELGWRSSVAVPVIVEGRLWGMAIVYSKRSEPLHVDTEEQLAQFTRLVETAIATAESRAELGRLADEQAALRRVATLVASGGPPEQMFSAVTREVGLLSGADLARMERYEADNTVTGVASWSRHDERLAVGTRFALEGVSIAAQVLQTSGPVRVETFEKAIGSIAQEARALGIRSSVGCPIVVAGRLWGVIAASSMSDVPFPPETESQMSEFTELVATAIANAESQAELRASRARIVAASDHTRRRIERDLHDGVQQRLVSLALGLRAATSEIPPGLGEFEDELAEVASSLGGVVDDLREVSRGIHPAILAEGGLGPALKTVARRSPVPVELELSTEERLADRIEVAAYYVVSEALTNAAKHASASVVKVTVEARAGLLHIVVSDDGVGGADFGHGSGLVGLKDRAEAIGGTIALWSPPGAGTSLLVELPLDGRQE